MLKFDKQKQILSGEVVAKWKHRETDEISDYYVAFNLSGSVTPAFWNSEEEAIEYLKHNYYHEDREETLNTFELVPVEFCIWNTMLDSACLIVNRKRRHA